MVLVRLESAFGKAFRVGMTVYLSGWLCFIACVVCTLAKVAQWHDVIGCCAFVLGLGSTLMVVGFLGLAAIGNIWYKKHKKGGKALPKE